MSLPDAIKALNPSGYWRLNEPSGFGTGFLDSSGNGHHGTAVPSPINGSYTLPTKGGAAPYKSADVGSGYNNVGSASFSGTNAIGPSGGSWLSNTTFSVIAFIKVSTNAAIQGIAAMRKYNVLGYNFWWMYVDPAGSLVVGVWNTTGSAYIASTTSATVVGDNTWRMVGFSFQESVSLQTWIDGTAAEQATPTGASHADTTTPLSIGCDPTATGRGFTGLMAEVAYFGGVSLTADQIMSVYKEFKRGGVALGGTGGYGG